MTSVPDRPRRHRSTLVRPAPSSQNIQDTSKSVDFNKTHPLDQVRAHPCRGGDDEIVPSSDPEERLQESIAVLVSLILIADLSPLIDYSTYYRMPSDFRYRVWSAARAISTLTNGQFLTPVW